MFHVVVMEETQDFPVMSVKGHYADKPHCRMYVVANNPQRVYLNAKIIGEKDWQTKRKKIKVVSESFCECGCQKDHDCKYCTSCNMFESV